MPLLGIAVILIGAINSHDCIKIGISPKDWKFGNFTKKWNHQDISIVKYSKNTKESNGMLAMIAITWSQVKPNRYDWSENWKIISIIKHKIIVFRSFDFETMPFDSWEEWTKMNQNKGKRRKLEWREVASTPFRQTL